MSAEEWIPEKGDKVYSKYHRRRGKIASIREFAGHAQYRVAYDGELDKQWFTEAEMEWDEYDELWIVD